MLSYYCSINKPFTLYSCFQTWPPHCRVIPENLFPSSLRGQLAAWGRDSVRSMKLLPLRQPFQTIVSSQTSFSEARAGKGVREPSSFLKTPRSRRRRLGATSCVRTETSPRTSQDLTSSTDIVRDTRWMNSSTSERLSPCFLLPSCNQGPAREGVTFTLRVTPHEETRRECVRRQSKIQGPTDSENPVQR